MQKGTDGGGKDGFALNRSFKRRKREMSKFARRRSIEF